MKNQAIRSKSFHVLTLNTCALQVVAVAIYEGDEVAKMPWHCTSNL